MSSPLVVVTASIVHKRTQEFWETWAPLCTLDTKIIMVVNSPEMQQSPPNTGVTFAHTSPKGVLGPVAAFGKGIELAIDFGASLIACFHDDVALYERGWDARIVEHFAQHPACTLAGYSGAEGLGAPDIYESPKELHQLARQGFFSNMVEKCEECGGSGDNTVGWSPSKEICLDCDGTGTISCAHKHGRIELSPRRSACADGFSQIGRAPFLKRAFQYIASKGVSHHSYDSWLGMLAWRYGGECWYLPERCHHAGGRTAVLAPEYHAFAEKLGGDAGIWRTAHEALYEDGKGFLPYRVDP